MSRSSRLTAVLFGVYFAALLWITMLSRVGNGPVKTQVYPPFWSIAEIADGRPQVILETAENILLFVPFGFLCRHFFCWNRKKTILLGFLGSLLIECTQLIFGLGSFEVDDLLTNTLGAVLGSLPPAAEQKSIRTRYCISLVAFVLAFCAPPLLSQIQYRYMAQLAANGNRADGTKNLLVLNGKPGFVGNSFFFVGYYRDGSISISGSSDRRAWKLIGELILMPGTYSFSGLSGTEEKTIAIELDYVDPETNNSIRMTKDVGPIEEVVFTLEKETKIRAYVGVYQDAAGNIKARPVIFREDK